MDSFFNTLKRIIISPYLLVIAAIIISLCSIAINGWTVKDYYIDRGKAQTIVNDNYNNGKYTSGVESKLEAVVNKKYYPINISYKMFVLSSIILLLLLALKIKTYSDLLKLPAISNKSLIFLWINLSYVLFAYLIIHTSMGDLEIEVLPNSGDSMGIPLFALVGLLIISAIPYYIVTNIAFVTTYLKTAHLKTDLSKSFMFHKPLLSWKYGVMVVFHLLSIVINLLLIINWSYGKFYRIFPLQVMFSLIWLYLSISALAILANKVPANKNEMV